MIQRIFILNLILQLNKIYDMLESMTKQQSIYTTELTKRISSSQSIVQKLKEDDVFAQNLYAGLCNIEWYDITDKTQTSLISWRRSGRLIADLRDKGETYLDFYCSGSYRDTPPYLTEGHLTDEVQNMIQSVGYAPMMHHVYMNMGEYDKADDAFQEYIKDIKALQEAESKAIEHGL